MSKQRRSQIDHSLVNRGPAENPSSLSTSQQQSWLLGIPDQRDQQKALAALRDVDLDTQYRYLSGMMGALYQGGMEGGWIRESPPPKAPKVSRRKPLTTSRMIQPSSEKEGPPPSSHEGGFEPLDLSRRPSPGLGEMEEDGVMNLGEGGVVEDNEGSLGVKLSQCLFCPFRTSSAELMAMHLQVNHTNKSRRKRGSSSNTEEDVTSKATKLDSVSMWKHVSDAESQVPFAEWSTSQTQTFNGLSEDKTEHQVNGLELPSYNRASVSNHVTESFGLREQSDEEKEDQEDISEDNLDDSSLGISPDPALRMSLTISPVLDAYHMAEKEETF